MNIPIHFGVLVILAVALLATVISGRHFEPQKLQDGDADGAAFVESRHGGAVTGSADSSALSRPRRSIGDFFTKIWTVGSLGKAQYDDTRTTLAKVYELLRDSFSDTVVRKTPVVVVQSGAVGKGSSSEVTEMPTTETTTEKYRISRKQLAKILNRNFRGLKRLAEIERREAYNATKYNIQEYKVQLANSLQSFVYNLPSNRTAN